MDPKIVLLLLLASTALTTSMEEDAVTVPGLEEDGALDPLTTFGYPQEQLSTMYPDVAAPDGQDTVRILNMACTCLWALFIPVIVTSNVVVIRVIRSSRQLFTSQAHMVLISLAYADLTTTLGIISQVADAIVNFTTGSSPLPVCRIKIMMVTLPVGASLWNMLLLCTERFFKIAHGIIYANYFTDRMVHFLIACVWSIMFGVCYLAALFTNNTDSVVCTVSSSVPAWWKQYIMLPVLIVPLLVVSVMYTLILRHSVISRRRVAQDPTSLPNNTLAIPMETRNGMEAGNRNPSVEPTGDSSTETIRAIQQARDKEFESRVHSMIMLTLGLMYAAWVPMVVFFLVEDSLGGIPAVVFHALRVIPLTFLYSNAFINPFLYAGRNPKLRQRFAKYFPWLR